MGEISSSPRACETVVQVNFKVYNYYLIIIIIILLFIIITLHQSVFLLEVLKQSLTTNWHNFTNSVANTFQYGIPFGFAIMFVIKS